MKWQQSGEELIGEKLNEIVAPLPTGLWQHMKKLLDKQMPPQKGRAALQECFCKDRDNENKGDPEQENGDAAEGQTTVRNSSLPLFN